MAGTVCNSTVSLFITGFAVPSRIRRWRCEPAGRNVPAYRTKCARTAVPSNVFLAVNQNPFVIVRVFGDIAQHLHGFLLVRHVRLFRQTGQTFPSDGGIATGDDTVRKRNTSAHIVLHCRTAFFRQPSIDSADPSGEAEPQKDTSTRSSAPSFLTLPKNDTISARRSALFT